MSLRLKQAGAVIIVFGAIGFSAAPHAMSLATPGATDSDVSNIQLNCRPDGACFDARTGQQLRGPTPNFGVPGPNGNPVPNRAPQGQGGVLQPNYGGQGQGRNAAPNYGGQGQNRNAAPNYGGQGQNRNAAPNYGDFDRGARRGDYERSYRDERRNRYERRRRYERDDDD